MGLLAIKMSAAAVALGGLLTQATPLPAPASAAPAHHSVAAQPQEGVLHYLIEVDDAPAPDIVLQWC